MGVSGSFHGSFIIHHFTFDMVHSPARSTVTVSGLTADRGLGHEPQRDVGQRPAKKKCPVFFFRSPKIIIGLSHIWCSPSWDGGK